MAKFVISAFADEAGASIEEQIKALTENGLSYIEPRMVDKKNMITLSDDELMEVTPKSLRLRKRILDTPTRLKAQAARLRGKVEG